MFFVVDRHLDVVLEDHQVVEEKSLFYKTCRKSRIGDAHQRGGGKNDWNAQYIPLSFLKETFLSNHQGILENSIYVTLDKEHLRKKIFFLCKSIIDKSNIRDLCVRKLIPTIRRTSGTTSRWRRTRNIVIKSSFFKGRGHFSGLIP